MRPDCQSCSGWRWQAILYVIDPFRNNNILRFTILGREPIEKGKYISVMHPSWFYKVCLPFAKATRRTLPCLGGHLCGCSPDSLLARWASDTRLPYPQAGRRMHPDTTPRAFTRPDYTALMPETGDDTWHGDGTMGRPIPTAPTGKGRRRGPATSWDWMRTRRHGTPPCSRPCGPAWPSGMWTALLTDWRPSPLAFAYENLHREAPVAGQSHSNLTAP